MINDNSFSELLHTVTLRREWPDVYVVPLRYGLGWVGLERVVHVKQDTFH